MGPNRKRAIVIGGSIGGLLAGRVLADHYESVIVLDRDTMPADVQQRRGVPQGRHTHGLLAGGRESLERLLPGFTERLLAAGGVKGDMLGDARRFHEGGCLARFRSGLEGILATRPLIEQTVRELVCARKNLELRDNAPVEGLESTPDRGRVTGVRLGRGEVLSADLVVDTSGRGSQTPAWLEALGYQKPAEERVDIALAYTKRWFRRDPRDLAGDIAVMLAATPSGKRGGVMLAQEGDRWSVTLFSHFSAPPPTELRDFVEYARTLPAPFIHDAVKTAEPLGEAATARMPNSIRRRYEDLARFPEGLLVCADAISSFSPTYAQGMTVAAMEALELDGVLRSGASPLARTFFRRASRIVDAPWSIAAGADLRFAEATGRRTPRVKFINWYVSKLQRAAHHDPALALAFFRVANLLAPPPTILRPDNILRVIRGNLLPPRGARPCVQIAAAGAAR